MVWAWAEKAQRANMAERTERNLFAISVLFGFCVLSTMD
jgi:hypothetical protein